MEEITASHNCRVEPCPYVVRASCNGQIIAETSAGIRVDDGEQSTVLWFPRSDLRLDMAADIDEVFTPGVGDYEGFVAFDSQRIQIDVVDGHVGDNPRDVTIKRFPTWGDTAHLIEVLDVQPDGDGLYHSAVRIDHQRPVVECSQILAQAIVAAGRHAPGRRVVTATMMSLRGADARIPLIFELTEIAAGRTFTTLTVRVHQGSRVCAAGILMLDVTASDIIRHSVAVPQAGSPYEAMPFDMGVTGRDLRVVDNTYTGDPDAPIGPPVIDAWVRFRDVPDDACMHAALLAQFSGHMSIAAAMRPHAGIGQDQAHRTLSTAISSITLSLHRDIHADEWMLYHHLSTFAGDGMTHAECRVHDEAGNLLASFTVQAMVRGFADPSAAVDHRTAL